MMSLITSNPLKPSLEGWKRENLKADKGELEALETFLRGMETGLGHGYEIVHRWP